MRRLCGFILFTAAILCTACSSKSTFEGSRIKNEDRYFMEYSIFNGKDTADIKAEAGDVIEVTIESRKGNIDITIGIDGEENVYSGNDVPSGSFSVKLAEAGIYRIEVIGENAEGSVEFKLSNSEAGNSGTENIGTENGEAENIGTENIGTGNGGMDADKQKQSEAERAAMLEAYKFALQEFAFEHIYPDGTDIGFDGSFGFIEENKFAITDVDRDGMEELIISFSTASMAGMTLSVYGYNAMTGELYKELFEFPAVTFYSNGIAKADWSHNQGLAGDSFWPYRLYKYNEYGDKYEYAASVDAWDKSIADTNYAGEAYPEETDKAGDGIVYLITQDELTDTVSKSDYESWYKEILKDAEKIEIPYLYTTEENIENVGQQ